MTASKRKIPGMLYILVSFIPWIIYWILCGMGNKLGVAIPLVIALLLLTFQTRKRDFNLMDITSGLYFAIAAVGTFGFNLEVFVRQSGLLGYSVLFLMALFSLLINKPYTLQVAKKDYPEIYWKGKSFIANNRMITGVWVGIFLVNAVIFLVLGMPLTVILSNTLIVFGIVFSIIFPLKAPAHFATKEFKKYDWRVEVDTQKPKEENDYDVIVVGSGIGGLTCGALLSKRGYKVLVLEQHSQVGGYCSSFKRKDFVFNAGVENVSGLWERGPITYLLKELGLKKGGLFAENRMRFIFKGKEIDASKSEELIKVLSEMFPEERENIRAFFHEARKAYDECYKEAEIYGVPLPSELIVKVFGERKMLDYPREHPHFYDWLNKTFAQKLNDHFGNEDLKEFLCALLPHFGAEPDKAQAGSVLMPCVSYFLYAGYSPQKAQRFADSLKEFIEKNDGKVFVGHKVDEILTERREVKGVKVGAKIFRSPVIVSNANAKTTFLELIPENDLGKGFVDYIKGLKMSPSCLMVSLGVDMELSDYPTPVHDLDGNYALVIASNGDPTLAPKGKASIMLLTDVDYHDFPERGTEEYPQKKNELAEMLIKKAEKVIPNLSKHIIVQDIATPKTFERYTSMPEGALYAFDQSIGTRRPYFKTPMKGLYLVGASTFPGGEIEAVVISGIICTNDICNWKTG